MSARVSRLVVVSMWAVDIGKNVRRGVGDVIGKIAEAQPLDFLVMSGRITLIFVDEAEI